MLCAIYLDPRVYKELNDKEIMIAKTTLADLHEKIVELKSNPTDSSMNSFNDSLEEYFRQRDTTINNNNASDRRVEFMQTLDNFRFALQSNSLKRKHGQAAAPNDVFSIFDFCEKQKMLYPSLYEVASVIFAIPPSQATVERSFSALNYLFSNRRCGLKPSLLEDCLMIKLNANIAQDVNERDLIEAEKEAWLLFARILYSAYSVIRVISWLFSTQYVCLVNYKKQNKCLCREIQYHFCRHIFCLFMFNVVRLFENNIQ